MAEIRIDSETLKSLICGAVSEAMTPYIEAITKQNGRILVLETINTQEKGLCPQNCPCQNRLNQQSTQITQTTESAKVAHHRIDGVFKTAAIVGGSVSGAVTLLLMAIQILLQWHGSVTKFLGGS
jgi:hypothetical protein